MGEGEEGVYVEAKPQKHSTTLQNVVFYIYN